MVRFQRGVILLESWLEEVTSTLLLVSRGKKMGQFFGGNHKTRVSISQQV
jgi:hypothetical protein